MVKLCIVTNVSDYLLREQHPEKMPKRGTELTNKLTIDSREKLVRWLEAKDSNATVEPPSSECLLSPVFFVETTSEVFELLSNLQHAREAGVKKIDNITNAPGLRLAAAS